MCKAYAQTLLLQFQEQELLDSHTLRCLLVPPAHQACCRSLKTSLPHLPFASSTFSLWFNGKGIKLSSLLPVSAVCIYLFFKVGDLLDQSLDAKTQVFYHVKAFEVFMTEINFWNNSSGDNKAQTKVNLC